MIVEKKVTFPKIWLWEKNKNYGCFNAKNKLSIVNHIKYKKVRLRNRNQSYHCFPKRLNVLAAKNSEWSFRRENFPIIWQSGKQCEEIEEEEDDGEDFPSGPLTPTIRQKFCF